MREKVENKNKRIYKNIQSEEFKNMFISKRKK